MGQTELKALKTFSEGLSIYAVLIAEPATGKSLVMSIVRKALVDIEEYLQIQLENSKLVNGIIKNFY